MAGLSTSVRIRLSIMMFLQFFVWGAWFVTLGTYLGEGLHFKGAAIGDAYSTLPWGAIVAPFFVGMIADRFFPAQIVLGICHLLGAVLLYLVSGVTDPRVFFWMLIAYAVCYNPTLPLVNAISFHQMTSPQKQFPAVRVFGTLGWIVAGLIVGSMGIEATAVPLKIAAGCSVLMGLFSFVLPHTPPKSLGRKVTVRDVLGLDALALLKEPSFAVFVIGSLLICIPLGFYYAFTNPFLNERGIANAAGIMTMGQMSEVFFMLVMPFFFVRLGVKKMLLFGMLAWVVRYVLLAFGNPTNLIALYYGAILLHGICYDFFFVTGQIYVDNTAPKTIQASAQGFIGVITYGVGMMIGYTVAGRVVQGFKESMPAEQGTDPWKAIWLTPAVMAAVVLLLFALFFREKPASAAQQPTEPPAAPEPAA
ncbi:MAG: nucleoside permease [Planctomycetota bacterium]|nr:nucleoside permease [Planctomycetota bacterium]